MGYLNTTPGFGSFFDALTNQLNDVAQNNEQLRGLAQAGVIPAGAAPPHQSALNSLLGFAGLGPPTPSPLAASAPAAPTSPMSSPISAPLPTAPQPAALMAPTSAMPAPRPAPIAAAPQAPTGNATLPSMAALQGSSPSPTSGGMFGALENKFGLPQGYLAQTAQIESGGNPSAINQGSGAAGLFQFVPSTAKSVGLANPLDPVASSYAAAQLASNNANVLRQALGRDPTAGELYLAHQQGAAGAAKLLTNPNAPAADVVGASAVKSNGGSAGMTAGQFASQWTSRFDGGQAAPTTQVAGGFGALPTAAQGGFSSANPFGSLPSVAQGGFGQGASLPTLAMGAPPPVQATGFSAPQPLAPMPANVPTMAYAPAAPSLAAAPAQQAINTATYGSTPLNINGKMMTRQQAEDNSGTDHTDYDDAAAKAGLISSAAAAPLFVDGAGAPVNAPVAPGTANAASPAAPQQQAPAPAAAPTQAGLTAPNASQIQALIVNPATRQLGLSMWQAQVTKQPVALQHIETKDGAVYAFNPTTGATNKVADGTDDSARPITPQERQAYGLPDTGAFEIQGGKVFAVPGTYDPRGGGSRNHVVGDALVDDKGQVLYQKPTTNTTDPDLVETLARRIYSGDTTALIGLGRGTAGAALVAAAQKRAGELSQQYKGQPLPDFPEADILRNRADQIGEQAGARASGTLNARLDTYAKEASGAMDLAVQASRQVPRTTWTPVNLAIQAVQRGSNDPNLAALVAANNAVINTYAKAINPNGVPTVSDKTHASEVLSAAQSPEAYEATISQLQREINIAHNAARGARAAERSGEAAQNMPVNSLGSGAPGSTSQGIVSTIKNAIGLGGSAAPAPAAQPAQRVQIQGASDYQALPSGTPYTDPNGVARIKP